MRYKCWREEVREVDMERLTGFFHSLSPIFFSFIYFLVHGVFGVMSVPSFPPSHPYVLPSSLPLFFLFLLFLRLL